MWLGDFEEGPYVLDQDQPVRTHLSAFIDCHSRYIVTGRYYFRQTLDILMDTLLRAWAAHGASRELYVDNAKVYDADALKAACYALNIKLLHRPPRDPAPGGLIERFFQTAQTQFEAEVRAGDILTLERLNRAFSAWLDVSYHQRTHSETGQTPQQRYQDGQKFTRQVDLQRALEFFLKQVQRTVDRKHCDVQLENCFFRVSDRRLRGDKVQVRYDPFAPLEKVFLYSRAGEYLGTAVRYQRERGAHGETPPPAQSGKPQHNYLDLLVGQHEHSLRERSQGIDYRQVAPSRAWPFGDFVQTLAQLSSNDLLRLLVRNLGETPLWSKDQLLGQIRERARQADGTLLVLLDEAHLLQAQALTDLRLLVSSALDDQPPLKLVLAGQPPLLELLRRHRDVLDRITVRYHLHPLSKPQTAAYLDFQVRTAGGTDALFEPAVKDLIHDYTGGVPRQINNLATACLLQAAVQNAARIEEPLLQQTLSEFHLP